MTVRHKYLVGRFVHPDTGRPVNVHCGRRSDNGFDVYYFLRSGRRVLVDQSFRNWRRT